MTTLDARPTIAAEAPDNYLTFRRGILSWLLTLDHKRIGVMYLVAVLASFFAGGVMALLIRTKLLFPGEVEWMTAEQMKGPRAWLDQFARPPPRRRHRHARLLRQRSTSARSAHHQPHAASIARTPASPASSCSAVNGSPSYWAPT